MGRLRSLRERFRPNYSEIAFRLRSQYTEIVIPRSGGHPIVVVARPKIDVTEPFQLPLSWVTDLQIAIRALRFSADGRPWVVQTYPRWQSDKAKTIAELPKWDAFERVKAEAASLRTPKT